jgi:hypothetical protein
MEARLPAEAAAQVAAPSAPVEDVAARPSVVAGIPHDPAVLDARHGGLAPAPRSSGASSGGFSAPPVPCTAPRISTAQEGAREGRHALQNSTHPSCRCARNIIALGALTQQRAARQFCVLE